MRAVDKQVENLGKTTERTGARMQSALGNIGRLFKLDLILRYGRQLLQIEDNMERLASQIRDTADRADIGVEALQRLRHAADQNGTSAEALDSALIRLNKALGLARAGTEGMAEIFAALGLEELIEKGATTEQVFYALSEAVAKMTDESQASAIMARIMGREADRLIELMKNGAVDVKRLGDELSRVISEETVNRLDLARDKSEEFRKVINSFISDTIALAFSIGETLVSSLKDMFVWLEKNTGAMTALADAWKFLQQPLGGTLAESFGAATAPPKSTPKPTIDPRSLTNVRPDQAAINRLFAPGGGAKRETEEAARAAERYRDTITDLTFEIEQLGRAEAEAAYQQDLRSALSSAGVTIESERGQAIAELVAQLHSAKLASEALSASWEVEAANANRVLREMHEEMRRVAEEWERIGATIEDAIADAFVEMAANMENAREIIAGLILDIGKLIAKALILKAIEGAVGAVFGPSTGAVGGLAMGGLVNPGNAYTVGEAGPELFVPRVSGNIVPNNRMGGGSNVFTFAPILNAQGANPATLAMIRQMLAQAKSEWFQQVGPFIQGQWKTSRIKFAG
jgi:hypothetical protein